METDRIAWKSRSEKPKTPNRRQVGCDEIIFGSINLMKAPFDFGLLGLGRRGIWRLRWVG
jgi:hypothetical protein